MKTIKSFVEKSSIPEKLIRAVIRQNGGFDPFKEDAKDIYYNGANAGFCGFIYYVDTVKFTKRNKVEIIKYVKEQAKDFGISLSDMISNFSYIDLNQDEVSEALYHHLSENQNVVYNILAHYMLEEVSRSYCDILEGIN